MFNHIRNVPYVTPDGKGGVQYFVGGFSNQLGLETQIVAAICENPKVLFCVALADNSQQMAYYHLQR